MLSPSYTQELLDRIRALPDDKIVEVADFVEFLCMKHERTAGTLDERLRAAVDAGVVVPPDPGAKRFSTKEVPPAAIPGKPASEMVIEDRR